MDEQELLKQANAEYEIFKEQEKIRKKEEKRFIELFLGEKI